MWYEIGADVIALGHFSFLALVVFGVLLGRTNRWWRLAHVAAMMYGVLIEIFYWPCPLTYLEQYLRSQAGRGRFDEPFIAHYLNQLVYLEAPQWTMIPAALAVLGTNCGLYLYLRRRDKVLQG